MEQIAATCFVHRKQPRYSEDTARAYKAARLQLGLTQTELAQVLGLSRCLIAERETGLRFVGTEALLALQSLADSHVTVKHKGRGPYRARKPRVRQPSSPDETASPYAGGADTV